MVGIAKLMFNHLEGPSSLDLVVYPKWQLSCQFSSDLVADLKPSARIFSTVLLPVTKLACSSEIIPAADLIMSICFGDKPPSMAILSILSSKSPLSKDSLSLFAKSI
ncbi:uncharacterized protein LOC107858567 [Capsicum annuum]|uniref:uncharacterized protein LOC107858567 n=1 Tax=Capsicum annuum TaxID=4072 RepID=UPI001FB15C86|nr:uncharacterized protein LOC107858567 [Capsicum annuum]